ncbi:hypothetical protein DID78_07160, partial [Candidatus Marinamargulisbacteria bacterium SCGC AG-343-D04]
RLSSDASHRQKPLYILNSERLSIPLGMEALVASVEAKDEYGNNVKGEDLTDHNVTISIPYTESRHFDEEDLVVITYDEAIQKWKENDFVSIVDTQRNAVYTQIKYTGQFAIAEKNIFSSTVSSSRLYPNPWIPNDGDVLTGDDTGITFDRLTTQSKISIYTITGELVHQAETVEEQYIWDGRNKYGEDVFSGVYLYVIRDNDDTKTGKITIVR